MFERFDEIFKSCGWRVVELRYGKRLQAALDQHPKLKSWFETLPNAELSALHYQGGAAWRARIEADLGKAGAAFLKAHDDDALASLFTDLGGHCMETLVEAFDAAQDDVPTLFIAWTIKGYRPALRRPQGQSRRPDEPDADGRAARGDGRARGP